MPKTAMLPAVPPEREPPRLGLVALRVMSDTIKLTLVISNESVKFTIIMNSDIKSDIKAPKIWTPFLLITSNYGQFST